MKIFLKVISFIIASLIAAHLSFSQNPEWMNYFYSSIVSSIAHEGSNIWIGTTEGGLIRLDTSIGEKVFYNTCNSGLPDDRIYSIAIDSNGNKWMEQ